LFDKSIFATMAVESLTDVGIVGAGVAGLSLAINLRSVGLNVTVYEGQADDKAEYTNLWTLTPNGLRSAEALGVLPELQAVGVAFEHITVLNGAKELISKREVGSESKHGYSALSISQAQVIRALTAKALTAGVTIHYEHVFASVVTASTSKDVSVSFTNKSTANHCLLIGADGLNSAVRAQIAPTYKTSYMGSVALAASAARSTLELPANSSLPLSIADPRGHVMFSPIGTESCSIAMAHAMEAPESGDWTALRHEKTFIRSLLDQKAAVWGSLVSDVVKNLNPASLSLWPMFSGAPLESWIVDRVILIGDAAHVLPPVGMLGGNLALEDALSLGTTLAKLVNAGSEGLRTGLKHWESRRMARLAKVAEVSKSFGKMSKHAGPPNAAPAAPPKPDNEWLYDFDAVKDLEVQA
jgi:2-polyprenyl-6-methoxyphenol hydroxylase-like FAD-dependent oxidoreductase